MDVDVIIAKLNERMTNSIPAPVRPASYAFQPGKMTPLKQKLERKQERKRKRIAKTAELSGDIVIIAKLLVFSLIYFAIFGAIAYGLFAVRLTVSDISIPLFPVVLGILGFIIGIMEGQGAFIYGPIIGVILGLLIGALFGWLFSTVVGFVFAIIILLIPAVFLYKFLLGVCFYKR
jgi:hypothetical protein